MRRCFNKIPKFGPPTRQAALPSNGPRAPPAELVSGTSREQPIVSDIEVEPTQPHKLNAVRG